jgi:uncharacterized cupin superfamily protein
VAKLAKAPVSKTGDSRFESWLARLLFFAWGTRMPNIFDPDFDQERDAEGFSKRRAFVGRQAGADKLGASVWEILPGEAAYPFHFHHFEEEMVVLIEGALELRTPDGTRELVQGDLVSFPTGPGGAHQLINRGDQPARMLSLSTTAETEIVVYPDSGKTGIWIDRGTPEQSRKFYKEAPDVGYWDGEKPPS